MAYGLSGLNLSYVSTTSVQVASGAWRRPTNAVGMNLAAAATVSTGSTGSGGMDTKSLSGTASTAGGTSGPVTGTGTLLVHGVRDEVAHRHDLLLDHDRHGHGNQVPVAGRRQRPHRQLHQGLLPCDQRRLGHVADGHDGGPDQRRRLRLLVGSRQLHRAAGHEARDAGGRSHRRHNGQHDALPGRLPLDHATSVSCTAGNLYPGDGSTNYFLHAFLVSVSGTIGAIPVH